VNKHEYIGWGKSNISVGLDERLRGSTINCACPCQNTSHMPA